MTNIALCGCNGKMGNAVIELIKARSDAKIVAGVDLTANKNLDFPVYHNINDIKEKTNVIIDFSHPSLLSSILDYCYKHTETSVILCTTGYTEEQTKEIEKVSKTIPVFYSRNMSLGVNLLIELAKKAESILGDGFDVEIIEMHHNQKIDAPSGTALMLADAINEVRDNNMKYTYDRHSQRKKRDNSEIGMSSVRGGTIVGEHQVIFAGNHEVLSISHSAHSKELFASGAVNAAIFMTDKPAGFYDMSNLI